jgi:hypothetical protein
LTKTLTLVSETLNGLKECSTDKSIMTNLYKEPRECECGLVTSYRSVWCKHRKICKHVTEERRDSDLLVEKDARIAGLEEQVASQRVQLQEREATFKDQLAAKDEQMQEREATFKDQLAAKDRQIDELIKAAKRPRTVNQNTTNNNHTNNSTNNYAIANLNAYGKESMDHISPEKLQELIKEPDTSLARLVALKHSIPENKNIRVPNKRDRLVERVTQMPDGEKVWEGEDKEKVVSDLVESTATVLEEAVDKTTGVGQRYERWVGRLMQSHDEYHLGDSAGKAGGKQFKQQMERVHHSLVGVTR